MIPPISSNAEATVTVDFGAMDTECALEMLWCMEMDVIEAQDTLLLVKANQVLHENMSHALNSASQSGTAFSCRPFTTGASTCNTA